MRLILSVAALALLISGCSTTPASSDAYTLTVELNTPFNKKFTMATAVTLNEPFELTKLNGNIRNTISGVLRRPCDAKYPLELTVSEWQSEKASITDTTELELELNKRWSGGPVASLVYARTVTLSKEEQKMQNN